MQKIRSGILCFLLILLLPLAVQAQEDNDEVPVVEIDWESYVSGDGWMMIDHPEGWLVEPMEGQVGSLYVVNSADLLARVVNNEPTDDSLQAGDQILLLITFPEQMLVLDDSDEEHTLQELVDGFADGFAPDEGTERADPREITLLQTANETEIAVIDYSDAVLNLEGNIFAFRQGDLVMTGLMATAPGEWNEEIQRIMVETAATYSLTLTAEQLETALLTGELPVEETEEAEAVEPAATEEPADAGD